MHIRRYLIVQFFFISLRGLLAELQINPPSLVLQSIQKKQIKMCPCILETELCTDSFNVPLILSPGDKDWYVINSQNLSLIDAKLPCSLGFVRTKIREGSFALLPNSSIIHVHSGLVFDTEMYCLDKSYSDDFAAYSYSKGISKLEATVCFEPPVLPLCCREGEIMAERNGTAVCDQSTRYTPPLNPKVAFDGEFHDWSSKGVYQSFPMCNNNLTFASIQNNQIQRWLDIVDGRVQFLWETGEFGKVSIDQPNFCVGQVTSYNSLSPSVAFCKDTYSVETLCKNKTCFSKCCSSEYVFDLSTISCEMDDFYYRWTPPNTNNSFNVFYGMPSCPSYFPLSAVDPTDEYALLNDGSLWIESHILTIPPSRYCIDYFRNSTDMIEAVLVCFDDSATQEEPYDISTLTYVILLLVSSLQLLIVTGIFLYRVIKAKESLNGERPQRTETFGDKKGVGKCVSLGNFHALVCEMMIFSAFQLLFVAVQQAFTQSLPTVICNVFATAAGVLELTAVGDACFLCIQYNYDVACRKHGEVQKYRWAPMIFHALPLIVSVVTVTTTHVFLIPPLDHCFIDAAMFDPWAGYPVTSVTVLLLLVATVLLYKHFIFQKCCSQIQDESSPNKINYRWWLCAKMVFIHTVYWVSYMAVWMSDSLAFWVFADISLVLKAALISCSLLRHHAKHHRGQTP